jgi:hypothetical protein
MIHELLDVKEGESVDELRARLARVLGRDEPVPLNAFLRAVDDPSYFSFLLTSRNAPGFLEPLLHDPANEKYGPAEEPVAPAVVHAAQAAPTESVHHSNAALVGRAAKAFIRWGQAGFSVADQQTIERREQACLTCPNLTEPRNRLQKLMSAGSSADKLGSRTGNKVCSLCGCQVSKKMRLPTESCPAAHPTAPGLTRWGEPAAQGAPAPAH